MISLTGVSENIYIKNGSQQPENQFPLHGMKYSLKNTLTLSINSASSGKKIKENGFQYQENVFENWFPALVSNSREKAMNKKIMFSLDRKYVSTSRNEGLVENYIFTRWKSCFQWQQYWKNHYAISKEDLYQTKNLFHWQ